MKRFLTTAIFTAMLTTTASAAAAGEVAVTSIHLQTQEIKPFNLVHRAYSGHFSAEGIPGFNRLTTAYRSGQLNAEDLVQTAINQGRLSPETLQDKGYINAVNFQLRELEQGRHDGSQ
jgi:hypothetical protein